MGQFRNLATGVVVSVDDSKDERFDQGWEPANGASKASAKKSTSKKSED